MFALPLNYHRIRPIPANLYLLPAPTPQPVALIPDVAASLQPVFKCDKCMDTGYIPTDSVVGYVTDYTCLCPAGVRAFRHEMKELKFDQRIRVYDEPGEWDMYTHQGVTYDAPGLQ